MRVGLVGKSAAIAAMAFVTPAPAAQIMPPAGYGGLAQPQPAIAPRPRPGDPTLTSIPASELAGRFQLVSSYPRRASVKVVGAFTVSPPKGARLTGTWSSGFLPVDFRFTDGRCFALSADYNGGFLSNGQLSPTTCSRSPRFEAFGAGPSPTDPSLRLIGTSWGFSAWAKAGSGTTLVTPPFAKDFTPVFIARMRVQAIMAMNGPDTPSGNVTLVGRLHGRLTVVTLEVSF